MPTKKKINRKQSAVADKHEVRVSAKQKFEVRKNASGGRTISGLAVVWNSLSHDLNRFRERVMSGAFSESLKSGDPVFLYYGHDSNQILGKTGANLTLRETTQGLYYSCDLPDTQTARDVAGMCEAGVLTDASFGFSVPEGGDEWTSMPDGQILRTITRAILYEASVVGNGAYPAAYCDLRSMPAALRAKLKRNDEDDEITDPCDPDYDGDEQCEDEDERCQCRCGLRDCASGSESDEQQEEDRKPATASDTSSSSLVLNNPNTI